MSDIEALVNEREGYLRRGLKDRAAQVDAELEKLGFAVGKLDKAPELEAAVTERPEKAVKAKPKRGR